MRRLKQLISISLISHAIVLAGCAAGQFALQKEARGDSGPEDEATVPVVTDLPTILEAHNKQRAAEKLGPLTLDPSLTKAASWHARDMAAHAVMSHEGSDGSKPNERVERAGYFGQRTGENVAFGQKTVAQVMKGWMNSPPHRANILGDFDQMGAARATAENGAYYWAVEFGLAWPKLEPEQAAADLLEALNAAREEAGKKPLKMSPKLQKAAMQHAEENADRDTIRAKDGKGAMAFDQVKASGYRFRELGQADGTGYAQPKDVLDAWLGSPPHKSQLLGNFTETGVGYARAKTGKPFWVLLLARPAPR